MPCRFLGTVFYLCLFVSGTHQAICPSGFSVESGVTGGIFATENTAAAERVRCTSTSNTNREIYEYMQTDASCTSGLQLCTARGTRCAAAGNDVFVVGSSRFCRSCDAGSIRSGQRCNNCAADTYRILHSTNVCQSCPTGKFSPEGSIDENKCGDDNCQTCDRGSYAPKQGSAVCDFCAPAAGSFDTTAGQPQCIICPADTVSSGNTLDVCTMQRFVVQTDTNVPAATGTIYTGHNNSIWFHIDNTHTSLRYILNSMRQDWSPGDHLVIASAIRQPQLLNPTALQCINTVGPGKWSPSNVNLIHSSHATRYVLVHSN